MNGLLQRAEHWLWSPNPLWTGRGAESARGFLRYVYATVRDLLGGQLNLHAMSLVYTTLLSIVPLLALSFSVARALGVHERLEPLLFDALEPLGDKGLEIGSTVMEFVDKVNFGVLGSFGLAVLIYTVISMVQKVESSCNYIWQVPRSRSLARKFSDYLSVLLIGPVLMVAALGIMTTISSQSILVSTGALEPIGHGVRFIGTLAPYLLVIAIFSFIYMFIPNTKVKLVPAVIGGAFAGIVWTLTGRVLAAVVARMTQWDAIYSSFAIVLVAMIWLYVNWLILLLGSQIAFYAQHPESMRPGQKRVDLSVADAEQLALEIMYRVGRAFHAGQPRPNLQALATDLDLPGVALDSVTTPLEASGVLVRDEDGSFLPGRAISSLRLKDILEAVRGHGGRVPSTSPVATVMGGVQDAIGQALGERTLLEFVEESSPAASKDETAAD